MEDKELWTLKDIKKYLLYYFDSLRPHRIFSLSTGRWILFFIAIYIVFHQGMALNTKIILFSVVVLLFLLFGNIINYLGGRHREWWKKKHGIPTRNDIKHMKEKENEKILSA